MFWKRIIFEINYLIISSSVWNCLFNKIVYLLFERILLPALNFAYGAENEFPFSI